MTCSNASKVTIYNCRIRVRFDTAGGSPRNFPANRVNTGGKSEISWRLVAHEKLPVREMPALADMGRPGKRRRQWARVYIFAAVGLIIYLFRTALGRYRILHVTRCTMVLGARVCH